MTLSGRKDIILSFNYFFIDQANIRCYQLWDLESLTLHQVKALGVSDASKACHLKSHNTFTQFYLKEVAGLPELFHLGPVVATQQIHHWTKFVVQGVLLSAPVLEFVHLHFSSV